MTRTMHMAIDVRGLLKKNKRELRSYLAWMLKPDGTRHTDNSLRDALMDALAQGFELLPLAKDCEGFDGKTGCPGHPVAAGVDGGGNV